MAIITFRKARIFPTMPFPTAPLRDLLITHLPAYKWQCGEHDSGGKTEKGHFYDHMLISGRSSDTIVFTELRAVDAIMPGPNPPHLWHLNVGAPTTEIQYVTDRITLIICMTLMIADEQDSRCQLYPGGSWLTAQGLSKLFERVIAGEPLPIAAGSVGSPAPLAPAPTAPQAEDQDQRAARIIDDALQSIIDEGEAPTLRKIRSILANNASPETRQLLSDVVAAHEAELAQGPSGTTPALPAASAHHAGGFGRKGL
ncbi:MAG: hypothetical protein ABI810_13315 [Sphingomonas bacterium]